VTPEEEARYYDVHCRACGQRVPIPFRMCCAECGHTWRWGWRLSLHDARVYWRMTAGGWRWWQIAQRIRPRRPSKVWVCPCCSHDL
jgi:hypothetical protein